jgi:hypothetical protein
MARAGIFIGVDKSGNLDTLNDAAAGARRMYEWALRQGMPDKTHAKLITDENGQKVTPDAIADAIAEICNGAGVDQLIVYFAGHGIYIRGDRWLLSEAPLKAHAAVNVLGSVELARRCGIPHVVMIADACRVAPADIQNQSVEGIEIFPNGAGGDASKPVDQFFACYLGRTAAEVKSAPSDAGTYSALYTDALLDALLGTRPEVLQQGDPGDPASYVRPWPLDDYLKSEVPRRVRALKLEKKLNQNPDSVITSRTAWLSRIEGRVGASRGGAFQPSSPAGPPPPSLPSLARDAIRLASEGKPDDLRQTIQKAVASDISGAAQFFGMLDEISQPFGPDHFESECGIKVQGMRIVSFLAAFAGGKLLGTEGNLVRIDRIEGSGASVLLRFANGTASVIPVIQGFIAALTFEDGELVNVVYEPSANTPRWSEYQQRMAEVRALRGVAATASHHGRFRLNRDEAEKVGRQMQYAKSIDPTLAVYAAYAYHDLQLNSRNRDMSAYLQNDIGVTLFDIELLGGELVGETVINKHRMVPFVPMLSQGWSLLRAKRVTLHPALAGIENHLSNSLWTQFDEGGATTLERAMQSKELQ